MNSTTNYKCKHFYTEKKYNSKRQITSIKKKIVITINTENRRYEVCEVRDVRIRVGNKKLAEFAVNTRGNNTEKT